MSDNPPTLDYRGPRAEIENASAKRSKAIELFWWGVLVVSVVTGFVMTIVAPT